MATKLEQKLPDLGHNSVIKISRISADSVELRGAKIGYSLHILTKIITIVDY